MLHSRTSRAFTLIELLVVIAIIGLLSSVVLASLNSARQKAQYTAVAQELQETYKAFYMLNIDNGCWPREGSTDCGGVSAGNPTIESLVANSSFGLNKYLSSAPDWPFSSSKWIYDNDGDTVPPSYCGSSYQSAGVNLNVYPVTEEQYAALEKILDGDDPSTTAAKTCGKIIYASSGGSLLFNLSQTP